MVYKKIKSKTALALAACVFLLAGCGDDTGVTVAVMDLADLEQEAGTRQASGSENPNPAEPGSGQTEDLENTQSTDSLDGQGIGEYTGEQEPAETVSITISAAGDVTLGTFAGQDYSYSFPQTYDQAEDKGYFFENVKDVFAADDITIVNLEGALTTSENMTEGLSYNMKGEPKYAAILSLGSVEAVSMGNNHRLDYGEEGTRDTVAALEREGIVYAYDENVGYYEIKGIRIGFVSVNEVYWGAAVEKMLEEGIGRLKEEGVDLLLACCHWGTELVNYPEDYQKTLGRKCIDWGADLVIGHHPHVLQGVDMYKGRYIIYSLGNFCFGANRNPADKDSMIFQQTFTFDKGVKREDGDVRIIPCSVSSVSSRNDFRPTPAQGEDAKRIIGRINEFSRDFGVTFAEDGAVLPNE